MDEKLKNSNGMSLLEVMIAMAVFAVFAVAFTSGVGYNIFSSGEFKEDLKLVELAEMKINELVVSPPDLKETLLEETKDSKSFEKYPDYQYNTVVKKFVIPDLSKIKGEEEGDDSGGIKAELNKRVFKEMKDNMEKMLWQLSVEVVHKESGRSHTVSTWLLNHEAQVQIGGF